LAVEELEIKWHEVARLQISYTREWAPPDRISYRPQGPGDDGPYVRLNLDSNMNPAIMAPPLIPRVFREDRWQFEYDLQPHALMPLEPDFVPTIGARSGFSLDRIYWRAVEESSFKRREPEEIISRIDGPKHHPFDSLYLWYIETEGGSVFWEDMTDKQKEENVRQRHIAMTSKYEARAGIVWKSVRDFIVGVRQYEHRDHYYKDPLESIGFIKAVAFMETPLVLIDELVSDVRCVVVDPLPCEVAPIQVEFAGVFFHHLVFQGSNYLFFYDLEARFFTRAEVPLDSLGRSSSSMHVFGTSGLQVLAPSGLEVLAMTDSIYALGLPEDPERRESWSLLKGRLPESDPDRDETPTASPDFEEPPSNE